MTNAVNDEKNKEFGFDVNKHNSDLFIALGNIKRGRAAVELQSQKMRAKVDPALLPPKSTPFTHTPKPLNRDGTLTTATSSVTCHRERMSFPTTGSWC